MALFFKHLRERFASVLGRVPAEAPRPPVCTGFRPGAGYVLVVDESDSTGSDFRTSGASVTTRIAAIQAAAQSYLRQLRNANPSQQVAVVGFSEAAHLYHNLAPVGAAFHSLSRAICSLHPQNKTNLSAGLTLAMEQLAKSRLGRRNVVVITDGGVNIGRESLAGLIGQAKSRRVRVFTIGVGNNANADYDRSLLVWMARATGGRFASVHSFGHLCRALGRVA